MGIPSRRRPCLGAGQGQGSMWSTRRLNDMDPCPWSATPLLPTWRDTHAAGDPPLTGPAPGPSRSRGLPEASAVNREHRKLHDMRRTQRLATAQLVDASSFDQIELFFLKRQNVHPNDLTDLICPRRLCAKRHRMMRFGHWGGS